MSLILVALFEAIDPLCGCLHFSASGHHDEVVILSSGVPSYLRKNKGGAFWETDLGKVDYLVDNIGEGGGK